MTIFETLSTLYSLSYTFSLFKTKNKTTGKFFFASEFVRFVFNFHDIKYHWQDHQAWILQFWSQNY